MDLSPILCTPILKEKIWGGQSLHTCLNKELPYPDRKYGESWEISTHPMEPATICNGIFNGQILTDVLQSPQGINILGEKIYHRYKGYLPLLIKYLDIKDKISIQVHPNQSYASSYENSMGKAECWYIIDASSDATIILGTKPGITSQIFETPLTLSSIPSLFHHVPVKPGDLVSISPGLIHGILSGSLLVCEIQQNSDLTYRLYDYDRHDPLQNRPLHIDTIKKVIDFNAKPDIIRNSNENLINTTLLDWPYFKVSKHRIEKSCIIENQDIEFWIVLCGYIDISHTNYNYRLKKGDVCLIPQKSSNTLSGSGELLQVHTK